MAEMAEVKRELKLVKELLIDKGLRKRVRQKINPFMKVFFS